MAVANEKQKNEFRLFVFLVTLCCSNEVFLLGGKLRPLGYEIQKIAYQNRDVKVAT